MNNSGIYPEKHEIPNDFKMNFPLDQKNYLINGELREWQGDMEQVHSPVIVMENGKSQSLIGSYPLMDGYTALEALDAAVNAYDYGRGEWPGMSIEQRVFCIERFTEMMIVRREEVVNLLMWEIGKNLADSRKEFDRTVEYIRDTVQAYRDLDKVSSEFTEREGIIAQIKRAPLGVVLCMGPFNYPLNETFTTLIPALIMGNTVVFKPPKLGVLLHSPLLEAFRDAFPKGVVNTVYGDGQKVIAPIMESGRINVLAFIGSCKVADILKKQHPKPHLLKSVLGLEAKNPAIVLRDADIDKSVKECVKGALSYNGQRCTALKIFFVHELIYEKFVDKFVAEVEKLKPGMPWDKGVNITPLPEENKVGQMEALIDDAVAKGAEVLNKSAGRLSETLFFPAVVGGVNDKMRLFHEEQFGPVVPILKFRDIKEPLKYIVESRYGQQASIFGQNRNEISGLVDTLINQVCRVNINSQCQRGPDIMPFTGRKDSAEATLSVTDALRVFSIRTLVALNDNSFNRKIIADILKNDSSNFLSGSIDN